MGLFRLSLLALCAQNSNAWYPSYGTGPEEMQQGVPVTLNYPFPSPQEVEAGLRGKEQQMAFERRGVGAFVAPQYGAPPQYAGSPLPEYVVQPVQLLQPAAPPAGYHGQPAAPLGQPIYQDGQPVQAPPPSNAYTGAYYR